MNFKKNFFKNYLIEAPIPLALERSLECDILSAKQFKRPILDIGCGEGLFAYILFDEKIDVGIDPNSKELERAKYYNTYKELICCYGNNIPKPSKFYNTIFSNSVMEHIPEIEGVLKEVHRLMMDDGDFYITVPTNYFDRYSVINQLLLKLGLRRQATSFRVFFNKFWHHYHYYTIEQWKDLFKKNGFEISETINYCRKATAITNDFLVPWSWWSFICKRMLNRWYISKPTRFLQSRIYFFLLKGVIEKEKREETNNGGIVFFHLKKKK